MIANSQKQYYVLLLLHGMAALMVRQVDRANMLRLGFIITHLGWLLQWPYKWTWQSGWGEDI